MSYIEDILADNFNVLEMWEFFAKPQVERSPPEGCIVRLQLCSGVCCSMGEMETHQWPQPKCWRIREMGIAVS